MHTKCAAKLLLKIKTEEEQNRSLYLNIHDKCTNQNSECQQGINWVNGHGRETGYFAY